MPRLLESDAEFLTLNYDALSPENQAKAQEWFGNYRQQQADEGEPLFPTQEKTRAERQAWLRSMFEAPDKIDYDPGPMSLNPELAKMQHANMALLSARYQKEPAEVASRYDFLLNDYARQKLGASEDVDTAKFYALAQKDMQRVKLREDTQREGMSAALRGEDGVKALAAWQAKNADRAKDDAGLFMRGYQQALEQDGEMLPIADRLLPLLEAQSTKKDGQAFDQTKAQELGGMIEQLAGMKKAQRKSVYRSIAARIQAAGYDQKGLWSQMLGFLDQQLYRAETTLSETGGIASDVATAVAGAQTRIPDTFDGSSVSLPVLSDEEQQALLRQRDYRERIGNVQEEIMQIVSGELDPVKPTTGWMNETVETGLIKAPGAVAPFMAASALLGPYGAGLVFTADFAAQNRRELVQSGLDADQARKVGAMAAPLQAAVESLSNMVSLGKFPAFQAALSRFTRPVGGASLVGRYVQNSLISGATEFTEEQVQTNLIVPVIQEVLGVFETYMPEVDWDFYKTRAANTTPELAATLLPMALVFGGVMTAADAKLSRTMTQNVTLMMSTGMDQAQAVEVASQPTHEQRIKKGAELWLQRKGTKASMEEAQKKLADQYRTLAADSAAAVKELEARGVLPRLLPMQGGEYRLTFNDGSTADFKTREEALGGIHVYIRDRMQRSTRALRETIDTLTKNLEQGREFALEISPEAMPADEAVKRGIISPQALQERAAQGAILDATTLIENSVLTGKALGDEETPLMLFGMSKNEWYDKEGRAIGMQRIKDDILRTTMRLWDGASPLTLIEEKTEGDAKVILSTPGKRQWMLDHLRAYEDASGDKLFTSDDNEQINDKQLIEAWSHMAQSYFVAAKDKVKGRTLGRYLRDIEEAELTAAMQGRASWWQAVVNRAQKLGELKTAGKLNEDVVAELEKQLGIDSQVKHEQEAMQEAQQVANEVAQQVDTSGYSEANPGPNGETFSIQRDYTDAEIESANAELKAMRDRWKKEGVDSFAYASRGDITLSEIRMPKNMRGQGVGTAKMNELLELAQKYGMRVLLTPSTDYGASSKARLEQFYKRFGFEKNAGRNKDYRTRETMIWRPQLRAIPADASKVVQMPDGARLVGPTTFSIRAYHGTPHKVDKFSLDKIGTGEGAQAYGWGLYFAQNRSVAERYRTALSIKSTIDSIEALAQNALSIEVGNKDAAIASLRAFDIPGLPANFIGRIEEAVALIEADNVPLPGNTYTVEILPDESEFLDWDKPLAEQSEKVKAALRELVEEYHTALQNDTRDWKASKLGQNLKGFDLMAFLQHGKKLSAQEASKLLASLAIPGIRYLDGGSRGAGDGTRNYVIFDENLVRILEENGKPVAQETFSLRVTPAQDAEYMAAVEAGDMQTAQRMVDEAAKAAGAGIPKPVSNAELLTAPVFWRLQHPNWALNPDFKSSNQNDSDQEENGLSVWSSLPELLENQSGGLADYARGEVEIVAIHGEQVGTGIDGEPVIRPTAEAARFRHPNLDDYLRSDTLYSAREMADNASELDSIDEFLEEPWKWTRVEEWPMEFDPVTYDDAGNIIPPSRRFDLGPDIRGNINPESSRAAGGTQETFAARRAIPADASKVVQMPDGARLVGPTTFSIRAFHGTPHKVDKFTTAKIGTGEGAQAYGWGLYFAESRDVADGYAVSTLTAAPILWDGAPYNPQNPAHVAGMRLRVSKGDREAAITKLEAVNPDAAKVLRDGGEAKPREKGNLYTVELLPNADEFLDWDKPLSEQSEKVKAAIQPFTKNLGDDIFPTGGALYSQFIAEPRGEQKASEKLASLGIPGIRYLDQGSRGAGDGTRNYVIFDENLVRILEENGKPVDTSTMSNDTFSMASASGAAQANEPSPGGLSEAEVKDILADVDRERRRLEKQTGLDDEGEREEMGREKVSEYEDFVQERVLQEAVELTLRKLGARSEGRSNKSEASYWSIPSLPTPEYDAEGYVTNSDEWRIRVASHDAVYAISDTKIKIDLRELADPEHAILESVSVFNRLQKQIAAALANDGDVTQEQNNPATTVSGMDTRLQRESPPSSPEVNPESSRAAGGTTSGYSEANPGPNGETFSIIQLSDAFQQAGKFYRIVHGEAAFRDLIESGKVRTNAASKVSVGASLMDRLRERPTAFPSFSKDYAAMHYAGSDANHFIIVTDDASLRPSTNGRHSKGKTYFPTNEKGEHLTSLPAQAVDVFRHIGNGMYQLVYSRGKLISNKATPGPNGETFSLRPGDFASRVEAMFSPFQRSPEARLIMTRIAKSRALKLGQQVFEASIRTIGSIDREARVRAALAEDKAVQDYLDGLTPAARQTLEWQPADLQDDPLIAAMLDFGKLMSKSTALQRGKLDLQMGDFDGAPWLPPSFYSKGAGIMPDQMAQAMFDAGLLPDAYTDTLWAELSKRIEATRKDKAAHREAVQAFKDAKKAARDAAAKEAGTWADNAKKQAGSAKAQRERIKAWLRVLDGILAASPPEVRARVGGFVKMAGIATDEAALRYLEDRVAKLDKELEKDLVKQARGQLERIFDKARPKSDAGEKAKGKLTPELHAWFKLAEEAAKLSPAVADERIQGIEQSLASDMTDAIKQELSDWLGRPVTDDAEAQTWQETRLTLFQTFGAVMYGTDAKSERNAAEITAALDAAREAYQTGRLAHIEQLAKLREKRAEDRGDGIQRVGSPYDPNKANTRKKALNKATGLKGRALDYMDTGLDASGFFLDLLGDDTATDLYENTRRNILEAEMAKDDAIRQRKADFDAMLRTAFPGKGKIARLRSLWELQQIQENAPIGTMSQLQAMQFTLWHLDPDSREWLSINGYGDEWQAKAEQWLTTEAKAVRSWLMRQYAGQYDRINPVFRRLRGVNLPRVEVYGGKRQIEHSKSDSTASIEADMMRGGMDAGFTKTRVSRPTGPPKMTDALVNYWQNAFQVEHYIAFAETVTELKAVFGHRDFLGAVETNRGLAKKQQVLDWISNIEQAGTRDAFAHSMVGKLFGRYGKAVSASALLLKLVTLAKQAPAAIQSAFKVGLKEYFTSLSRIMAGKGAISLGDMYRSDTVQRRLSEHDSEMLQASKGWNQRHFDNEIIDKAAIAPDVVMNAGWYGIGWTDARFTTISAAVAYDVAFRDGKKLGMPDEEAKAFAADQADLIVMETAQPQNVATKSLSENMMPQALLRLVFQFMSANRQIFGLTYLAAKQGKVANAYAVAAIIAAMTQTIGGIMRMMFTDDEPEELFDPQAYALGMATAPLTGMVGLGPLVEFGLNFAGVESRFSPSSAAAAKSLQDIVNGEADTKDIGRVVSMAGAALGGRGAMLGVGWNVLNQIMGLYENVTANE